MSTETSLTSQLRKKQGKRQMMRDVDGIKYFNAKQIKLIRREARGQPEIDEKKGKVNWDQGMDGD